MIAYLIGFIFERAREGEEAMKELVIKSGKLKKKPVSSEVSPKGFNKTYKAPDGTEIIL